MGDSAPQPRAHLLEAPPAHRPREQREGYLRLDLNEDLSGPLARVAMPRGASVAMYHTTERLTAALAGMLELPESAIAITAGADEGIYGLLRAYLSPGDALLLPWPTFVEFPVVAAALDARVERAPYGPDLAFPLAAYRAALARGPRVAVIVSPANPTGEALPPDEILALAASAPDTLVLVDEAYAEYAGRSVLDRGMPPPNVAVVRTFSKAYGLAGARVGYVVAHPQVLAAARQVLPTYSLAGPSLALALAGLAQRARLERRVRQVAAGQRRIAAWGRARGVHVHTTSANFVLLRFGDDATARALLEALERERVLVADRTAVLPGALRVGVGAPAHVGRFLRIMDRVWPEIADR